MNLLDLIIIIPVGYFAFKGFMSGFVREVFGIAGIILGVFLTFKYMHVCSVFFKPMFNNPDHATITAGIVIFSLTIAAVFGLSMIVQKFFEVIKINFINRFAGLIFGALKSAVVISAILLLLAGFNLPGESTRDQSLTYPVVIYLAPAVFDFVSQVYPGAENFIDTIEMAIEENNPIKTLPIFERLNR